MKDNDNTSEDNDVEEEVEEMLRWEDDGGQNVGCDYEWLPATSAKRVKRNKELKPTNESKNETLPTKNQRKPK